MRLARILIVPLIAAALVASTALPAAAQTSVSLRYWPTNHFTALAGGASARTWDAAMISVGLRRDLPNNWGISFNGDFGSQTNWAGAWAGASSGNDSFWNINLHRNFPTANGAFSGFVGYGSAGYGSVFLPITAAQTRRYNGFRAGADMRFMTGAWTVMAWGATGIGGTTTTNAPGVSPTAENTPGTFSELGATVGFRTAGGWSIDAGYRSVTFTGGASTTFVASNERWQGWLIGVSRSLP